MMVCLSIVKKSIIKIIEILNARLRMMGIRTFFRGSFFDTSWKHETDLCVLWLNHLLICLHNYLHNS